jgi:hypothetical protein
MGKFNKKNRKPNHFKKDYDCAEPDNCYDCFWWNGEQCIRELLPEGDIQEIEDKQNGR